MKAKDFFQYAFIDLDGELSASQKVAKLLVRNLQVVVTEIDFASLILRIDGLSEYREEVTQPERYFTYEIKGSKEAGRRKGHTTNTRVDPRTTGNL